MVEAAFVRLLQTSLRAIADDVPTMHTAMLATLAELRVLLVIDGEPCLVANGRVERAPHATAADVTLATDGATILRLVDGEQSLLAALRTDRLVVAGRASDLATAADAFQQYLAGIVRSDAALPLLAEYRREVNRGA